MVGGTFSRVITAVGGILLAKYYGEINFGIYSVFLSYIMILPVLTSLRLDNIMILQKGSTEIKNLFNGIVLIVLALNILVISSLIILKATDLIQFNLPYYVLILCGVGSVLTGWNFSQNYMFTKYKLFKQISISFVLASIISVLFQTVFYFADWTTNGLIYGWMIGLFASFIYNARVSKSRIKKVDVPLFKQSVKDNIKIVQYTYPSDSLNVIANNIMPILILLYFSESDVGVYAMAFKILSMPLILLATSVSRVYFQKAVSLFGIDNKALQKLTHKVIFYNVGLIFLFVILMNTIGIYLFEVFFEGSWEGLRAYILALSFWILARSAMNPISDLIVVLKKNQYALIFNIYLLLANFIGIYFGVIYEDFLYCVWIFSILSGIGYLILLFIILYNLRKNVNIQQSELEE